MPGKKGFHSSEHIDLLLLQIFGKHQINWTKRYSCLADKFCEPLLELLYQLLKYGFFSLISIDCNEVTNELTLCNYTPIVSHYLLELFVAIIQLYARTPY